MNICKLEIEYRESVGATTDAWGHREETGGWWVFGSTPWGRVEMGPYRTRKDAKEDRDSAERFHREKSGAFYAEMTNHFNSKCPGPYPVAGCYCRGCSFARD